MKTLIPWKKVVTDFIENYLNHRSIHFVFPVAMLKLFCMSEYKVWIHLTQISNKLPYQLQNRR